VFRVLRTLGCFSQSANVSTRRVFVLRTSFRNLQATNSKSANAEAVELERRRVWQVHARRSRRYLRAWSARSAQKKAE
jgi:hypothetical protein